MFRRSKHKKHSKRDKRHERAKEAREHKIKRRRAKHRESLIETETQLVKKIAGWIFQAKGTALLIIINLVVYFISLGWSEEFFKSMIFMPDKLFQMPQVASWFMHANLTHLIGNLIFLFIFGRVVERRFGFIKFLLIYFCAAFTSDIIAGFVFGQGGIGASGAIAGLIAAAIIIAPFYLTYVVFGIPTPIVVLGWIAMFADITGLIAPVPGDNVGHIAHLAGFLAITVLIFVLNRKDKDLKFGLLINFITMIFAGAVYYIIPGMSFNKILSVFQKSA
ncbi:rhomboid family intramembrane serine protease [Candidatus Woesearchaeota archaeon]|nr:rhomboid family intramembrane serine protease [Candidatus Woesearchaeota archaeon]